MAPDTWIAPDAVIIGDVDLYDRVRLISCRTNARIGSFQLQAFAALLLSPCLHGSRTEITSACRCQSGAVR